MTSVLFSSVRHHYPEADLFLFMVGTGEPQELDNGIQVIYVGDIVEADDLEQRLCFYLNVELATSLRPHCFQALFDREYGRVIYVDPDLYIFRRMTEVDDLLSGGANGIVTPHALRSISPMNAAIAGGDKIFLQVGIFNLGFLALNHTPEAIRMVAWWREKLKWQCVADQKNGLFVDQRWLEFLPVYFEGFHILRLPTYNLAPWNAEHYSVIKYGDAFYIDTLDQPVAFIHFSGVRRSRAHFKDMISAHEFYMSKLKAAGNVDLAFEPYSLRIKKGGIVWDKILTFLYKDYISASDDVWNGPLCNDAFYNYATGMDIEINLPRYLVKAIELYPRFAAAVLFSDGEITYDNLLKELDNDKSPYADCACHETVAYLKQMSQLPTSNMSRATVSTGEHLLINPAKGPVRRLLRKSRVALKMYARARVAAIKFFNIHVEAQPIDSGRNLINSELVSARKDAVLARILLRKSPDTEYVK